MMYALIGLGLAVGFMYIVHNTEKRWNTDEFCMEQDRFKSNHGIWREWTGSQYVERINPNPHKDTDGASIIQRNWQTGVWEQV